MRNPFPSSVVRKKKTAAVVVVRKERKEKSFPYMHSVPPLSDKT